MEYALRKTAEKFIKNIADAEAELSKSIRDAGAEI
jgi:hypothetical protein